MPRAIFLLLLMISGGVAASDNLDPLAALKLVGSAKYSYMFWNVYDIELLDAEAEYDESPPFALRLKYLRDFSGSSIADRSSKLIRVQGIEDEIRLAAWHAQMDKIFPDVVVGDSLSGLYNEKRETVFFHNGELIGRIQDPLFGQYFFGIWLGENTTESKLREKLIGTDHD